MKKSVILLINLGFWFCYSFLVFVILAAASNNIPPFATVSKIVIGFGYLPTAIGFYAFYNYLFTNYFKQKKFALFGAYSLLISFVAALLAQLFLFTTLKQYTVENTNISVVIQITIFIAAIAFISGIVGLVIKGFISWFSDIKLKQELTEKNHQMELALVKAQLDPHFLFNTINNIDVLNQKDANKASDYLNKLSDIMRFMLFETKAPKISLNKEIEYIHKFIELQKIRSTNPNFVSLKIKGEPESRTIAPMIFIPFIENAFKHVSDKQLDNAIEIELNIKEDETTFKCSNIHAATSAKMSASNGLGNSLIQKRLQLLYPKNHNLSINKKSDKYLVTLAVKHD